MSALCPGGCTPPRQTPLPRADTRQPPGRHAPGRHPPPPSLPLQRTPRILLECILVQKEVSIHCRTTSTDRHRNRQNSNSTQRHWSLSTV